MNAKLTCLDYAASPAEFPVDALPLVIGRSCEAQICLDDRWVSRRHCEIEAEGGVLVVRDLGSKYGTFVNGQPVTRAELLPGDMLGVGLSNFIANYDLAADDSVASACRAAQPAAVASLELVGQV